ncbi:hypothetical protein GCM10009760_28110 [Kitasatospora kazusensis]|uniref:Uncharacterized protein n=1 Tax=Kitasatospora kazusensis TaxID=407974 RepID=A0ABP5LBL1_9ACTN
MRAIGQLSGAAERAGMRPGDEVPLCRKPEACTGRAPEYRAAGSHNSRAAHPGCTADGTPRAAAPRPAGPRPAGGRPAVGDGETLGAGGGWGVWNAVHAHGG